MLQVLHSMEACKETKPEEGAKCILALSLSLCEYMYFLFFLGLWDGLIDVSRIVQDHHGTRP